MELSDWLSNAYHIHKGKVMLLSGGETFLE